MDKKTVLVIGATGTQGGSVARALLKQQDKYTVRCLTRSPESPKAQALANLGASLIQADLTIPSTLPPVMKGVWGVFAVTDFYDTAIVEDPASEEEQGRNLVKSASQAGVQCFLWSTLPSSGEISGGKFVTRLYEGKHSVDDVVREYGLPGAFILTGNFYENMITRKYASYDKEKDVINMVRPVVKIDTDLVSLYVEKDLGGVCAAIFDLWDTRKEELNGKYYLASGARETPRDMIRVLEKVSGKKVIYGTKPTCGIKERDIMMDLYNNIGMYPGLPVPTKEVLSLGIKLHTVEDFIRDRLLPHLGLESVV
ncbi:hypothetical protein BJX99DRAFT_263258 [Aspergillus californicus]